MNKGIKTTKDPLTNKQQEKILQVAESMGNFEGVSVQKTVLVLLDTGMHISVLAKPEKHRVRFENNDEGTLMISWSRPKKKGSAADTRMKTTRRIRDWVAEFMAEKRPDYTMFYWRMIKELGKIAEIKNLSPMTFRHTFGVNLSKHGIQETQIKQFMNCSSNTLNRYLRYNTELLDKVLTPEMGY